MAGKNSSDGLKELLLERNFPALSAPPEMRPLECERALARLRRKHGDTEAVKPKQFNPVTTYEEITSLHAAKSLDSLSPRSLKQAPWVCFHPIADRPILGQDPAVAKALLKLFVDRGRPSLAMAMLHCFLRDYPQDWPTFDVLRVGIQKLLESKEDRRTITLERVRRNFLLENGGPARLAKVVVLNEGSIADEMADAKLVGELAAGRFARTCFLEMCRHVAKELEAGRLTNIDLQRFLEYAANGEELRFPAERVELANSLLEPFVREEPDAAIKGAVQGFLLQHFHDPRLSRERWLGVSEAARGVVLRWLVGATLEDFFRVLDKTAPGTEEGRRWTYRKAFWGAYNKKRLISDAWIALGPDAKMLIKKSGSNDVLRYGRLDGATPVDCLLLLRVGNLTIAEWSHTGSCRVWLGSNKTKPELYKWRYFKSSITSSAPDAAIRHAGAQSGHWQNELASVIRRHTAADVKQYEYMPRSRTW